MNSKEKIEYILNEVGLKAPTFASKIEVPYARIYDIQREKTKNISGELAKAISSKYPQYTYEWLLGDEEILKNSAIFIPETKQEKITILKKLMEDVQKENKRSEKMHLIPLMNIDAVGGSGNDICDTSEYIEDMIPVRGARISSICIPVSGDSMMPIFNPGDLVVIDEVAEWNAFLEMGQYYVIILNDSRRLIKKVTYSEEDKKGNFLLVSENPKYPPVELPKRLINKMFAVTQKHQKLTL